MARIYRPTYKARNGRTRDLSRWYVEAKHAGRTWRIAGFTDHVATVELGRQIDRLAALRGVRQPPDPELVRAIAGWPADIRARVAKVGLLASSHAAGMRPLADLVEAWRVSLIDQRDTEHHARQSSKRVLRIFERAECQVWTDLEPLRIERALAAARRAGPPTPEGEPGKPGISVATSNAWLTALRGFVRWAVRNGLAVEDPVRSLRPLQRDRSDDRVKRRALAPEALRALLLAAESGPTIQEVSGHVRALVYRLAATSGLRAREIRSLRVGSFDLDSEPPTVTVQAAYSKRRRDDRQPIPRETAEALRPFLSGRMPSASAFGLPRHWRSAEAIREDLKAAELPDREGDDAKIPYADAEGRVADFHALRHGYVSALAAGGVAPKVAQALARHSTITLTLDRYTHLRPTDERDALHRLPSLDAPNKSSLRATGTDGDMASGMAFRAAGTGTEPQATAQAEPRQGGEGGTRTPTGRGPADFKSAASADSATSPGTAF